MSSILDLEIFMRTADSGSFSAAARALELTPAAASIAIKRLETRLGVRLLVRSTRSLRLTEEGGRYLDSVRLALGALAEGEQSLRSDSTGLSGILQLAAPSDFGRNVLLPWLDEFKQQHPQLQLRLLLNDRNTNLFREPVDIALRFGVPADSTMVALPIASQHRRLACASPAYLEQFGTPKSPAELGDHRAVLYLINERAYDLWRFTHGSEVVEIAVRGDFVCDDGEVARRWALAGHGIVYKSQLDVQEDLNAGRLVRLFPDWQGDSAPLNLICPHRAQVSARVKALHLFLQQNCAALLQA